MGKFKVGDRVKIVKEGGGNCSGKPVGYEFNIEEINKGDRIFYREHKGISTGIEESLLELVHPLDATFNATPMTLGTGINMGDYSYDLGGISGSYSNAKWCLYDIGDKTLDEIIEKYGDKIKEKMGVLDVKNYMQYFNNETGLQDYQEKMLDNILKPNNKQMNKLQEKLFDRFLKSNETKIIETTEKLEEKLELLNNIYLFLNSRKDEIKNAKSNLEESFERQDKDLIKTHTKEGNELLKKLDDPLYEQLLTIVESLKE